MDNTGAVLYHEIMRYLQLTQEDLVTLYNALWAYISDYEGSDLDEDIQRAKVMKERIEKKMK